MSTLTTSAKAAPGVTHLDLSGLGNRYQISNQWPTSDIAKTPPTAHYIQTVTLNSSRFFKKTYKVGTVAVLQVKKMV